MVALVEGSVLADIGFYVVEGFVLFLGDFVLGETLDCRPEEL